MLCALYLSWSTPVRIFFSFSSCFFFSEWKSNIHDDLSWWLLFSFSYLSGIVFARYNAQKERLSSRCCWLCVVVPQPTSQSRIVFPRKVFSALWAGRKRSPIPCTLLLKFPPGTFELNAFVPVGCTTFSLEEEDIDNGMEFRYGVSFTNPEDLINLLTENASIDIGTSHPMRDWSSEYPVRKILQIRALPSRLERVRVRMHWLRLILFITLCI